MKLIIVRGLPYSDRTIEAKRLAKKKKTVRISLTDIMRVIGGSVDEETCMRMAYNAAWQAMRTAFVRGYSVVLDEVNLGEAGVQPFIVLANEKGASVEYVTVRTPVEECVRRARECDGDVEVVRYYHGLYRALLEE